MQVIKIIGSKNQNYYCLFNKVMEIEKTWHVQAKYFLNQGDVFIKSHNKLLTKCILDDLNNEGIAWDCEEEDEH